MSTTQVGLLKRGLASESVEKLGLTIDALDDAKLLEPADVSAYLARLRQIKVTGDGEILYRLQAMEKRFGVLAIPELATIKASGILSLSDSARFGPKEQKIVADALASGEPMIRRILDLYGTQNSSEVASNRKIWVKLFRESMPRWRNQVSTPIDCGSRYTDLVNPKIVR